MYSEREFENACYYPACGDDLLGPVADFPHISLFIYVDWWNRRWSQTREERLRRESPANAENSSSQSGWDAVFRPINRRELEERLGPPVIGEDFGFKGTLTDMLRCQSEQSGPDRLEYISDQAVPFASVGAIGLDLIEKYRPTGFFMEPFEEESYRSARDGVCQEPWAREITLSRRTGDTEHSVRFLYITGEGIATYCKIYADHGIAPRVLITGVTGMGGFAPLEDSHGIMARLLGACEAKPRRWVRSDGHWEWSGSSGNWARATGSGSEA
jgi:hypothetical protein